MNIVISYQPFVVKSKCHIFNDSEKLEEFDISSNLLSVDFREICKKYNTNEIQITNLNSQLQEKLEEKYSELNFKKIN